MHACKEGHVPAQQAAVKSASNRGICHSDSAGAQRACPSSAVNQRMMPATCKRPRCWLKLRQVLPRPHSRRTAH